MADIKHLVNLGKNWMRIKETYPEFFSAPPIYFKDLYIDYLTLQYIEENETSTAFGIEERDKYIEKRI